MSSTLTVALLGTGIMGSAMARNLAKAGMTVHAWNRTKERAEPLVSDGVQVTATPAEAADGADVIITMVFDGAAVREVIADASPRPGTIWLQTTTVSIKDVAGLAAYAKEKGLVYYDMPVLGTREPAEAGKLTIIAAGPVDQREKIKPVLDTIGARTLWQGEDGAAASATRLKLVANSWTLATVAAGAEVLALAEALGVNLDRFFELIGGGPTDQAYLKVKTDLIRNDKLSPASFAVDTAAKDSQLIVDEARARAIRLDIAEATAARLRRADEKGHGSKDMAASYYASFED